MNQKSNPFHKYQLVSNFNIPTILGLGTHGTVQLAINKETHKYIAVKKIPRKLAFKESAIHSQFNHPNIAKFI